MIFTALKPLKGFYPRNVIYNISKMSTALESIRDVDIDPEGTFKYILIKIFAGSKDSDPTKMIVRGYKRCAYHVDIYDEVTSKELAPKKLGGKCLGGGRIQHEPQQKKIKVYGYSQGFGKADHTVSVGILQKVYPEYSITWSDEGY